jgi:hypothetical protein
VVTPYSQRDTEWSPDKLGSNPPTMGEVGCLVTSVASVVTDLTDYPMSPGYLNGWLRENKGFAAGNLFVFGSVAPLGLRLGELVRASTTPMDIAKLAQAIKDGAGVIVQVDSKPGGELNQHWVRVLSVDENDGQIMDPWQLPGREFTKLSIYFASGWNAARAIFIAAIYRSTAARGAMSAPASAGAEPRAASADPLVVDTGEEYQPALCPRPPD